MKSVRFGDILSFGFVIVFFLVLAWIGWSGERGSWVEIRVENRMYRYPLDEDRVFAWKSSHGRGVVEIKGGKVRMRESDCRDQICVHKGWISHLGDAIICMPNRVVVEIVGEEKAAWDGITE
ncbi:NusG domain II-containing protein [Thermospira aquatica]|uniref:NusG domain II-containing protein n=1 Tax=Thermospira aquatica TaxID=2828656 RepID=A0AAX3BD43_9SPIR|nr:NusG domain II-containing protein [Thermospira aquatica]URA10222.1 NusG domain II-containing protein [Thermospira aquatica]